MLQASDASHANISSEKRDAFALIFAYDSSEMRFHIAYGIGITVDSEPPSPATGSASSYTWDFRDCSPGLLKSWQAVQAQTQCAEGEGLVGSAAQRGPATRADNPQSYLEGCGS